MAFNVLQRQDEVIIKDLNLITLFLIKTGDAYRARAEEWVVLEEAVPQVLFSCFFCIEANEPQTAKKTVRTLDVNTT